MSKSEAYQKLAECVEALEEVDGIVVEEAEVDQHTHDVPEPMKKLARMGVIDVSQLPMQGEEHTVLFMACTLDEDGPKQKHQDEPDDGQRIQITEGAADNHPASEP